MKSPLLFLFLTIIHVHANGQNFKGKLVNKTDSTALAFAAIKLSETGKYATTDEKGEFTLPISEAASLLHLEVSYVGCKTSATITPKANAINTIYVACAPSTLNEIVIEGLTAKEIVKRALMSIPKNYADSSYASPSFYRQYQRVNGKFRNLIEAQTMVMFNVSTSDDQLLAKESFATEHLRRSKYYEIEQFDRDNINDQTWSSQIINIAGLGSVNANVNLSESGTLEATDSIMVYYSLNGGPLIPFTTNGIVVDDFGSAIASVSNLTGNTLQIFIKVHYSATSPNSEIYTFDNVTVSQNNFEANSNPVFTVYPPLFLCVNTPFTFDHSATDIDGDSLVYDFYTPYNGENNAGPLDPTFTNNTAVFIQPRCRHQ